MSNSPLEAMSLWWPVTVGSRSVVATSLSGHVTVGSVTVVLKLLYGTCHSGENVSGGHVTVSNRPVVAM